MTLLRPLWMQPVTGDPDITYPAVELRALFDQLYIGQGVFRDTALRVRQRAAGATMDIEIDAGSGAVEGDDVANQRKYFITSDAVETRTIPAAPASGTRVHRVVAQVQDKLHNSAWTGYSWAINVLEDTGTGTPAEPASAMTLATVSVAAGQTTVTDANITNQRLVFTVADSGDWTSYVVEPTNEGTATFTVREGFWYRLAPKVITVYLQMTVDAAGSGTNPFVVSLPFIPQRGRRQVWHAHYNETQGQALVLAGGPDLARVDRIRLVGGANNMSGADLTAGSTLSIQGTYRTI